MQRKSLPSLKHSKRHRGIGSFASTFHYLKTKKKHKNRRKSTKIFNTYARPNFAFASSSASPSSTSTSSLQNTDNNLFFETENDKKVIFEIENAVQSFNLQQPASFNLQQPASLSPTLSPVPAVYNHGWTPLPLTDDELDDINDDNIDLKFNEHDDHDNTELLPSSSLLKATLNINKLLIPKTVNNLIKKQQLQITPPPLLAQQQPLTKLQQLKDNILSPINDTNDMDPDPDDVNDIPDIPGPDTLKTDKSISDNHHHIDNSPQKRLLIKKAKKHQYSVTSIDGYYSPLSLALSTTSAIHLFDSECYSSDSRSDSDCSDCDSDKWDNWQEVDYEKNWDKIDFNNMANNVAGNNGNNGNSNNASDDDDNDMIQSNFEYDDDENENENEDYWNSQKPELQVGFGKSYLSLSSSKSDTCLSTTSTYSTPSPNFSMKNNKNKLKLSSNLSINSDISDICLEYPFCTKYDEFNYCLSQRNHNEKIKNVNIPKIRQIGKDLFHKYHIDAWKEQVVKMDKIKKRKANNKKKKKKKKKIKNKNKINGN